MESMIVKFARECVEKSNKANDEALLEAVVQALDSGDFVFSPSSVSSHFKSHITKDESGNETYHHEWYMGSAVYIPYRGIMEARKRIAELETQVKAAYYDGAMDAGGTHIDALWVESDTLKGV